MGLLTDPDGTDHRIQHVIHHHAPAGDVAECRINLLAHVCECRTRAGIGARLASVANRSKQHGHHGDENCRDHMSMTTLAEHAKHRHWRDRLNYHDAVENEVPETESAPEFRRSRSSCAHEGVLGYMKRCIVPNV